jgi:hypothetical protein
MAFTRHGSPARLEIVKDTALCARCGRVLVAVTADRGGEDAAVVVARGSAIICLRCSEVANVV